MAGVGQLLERETEQARLAAALQDSLRGDGRLILIEGSPGIGKTMLLSALRARAQAEDVTVLSARGSERELEFAFGVARQLFEAQVRADPAVLTGAAELARSVIAPGPDDEGAGEASFGILHGLFWLVAELAERRPVLLLVDDAQWADAPSLRFFAHIAVRLEGLPVLAVLTARSGDATLAVGPVADLSESPGVELLALRPLGPGAVARLVRERLGPGVADDLCGACHRASRGNPFLLRELLEDLARSEGGLPDAGEVSRMAPAGIIRSVDARLRRLPTSAAVLARAIAVLGDPADLAQAAALAGLGTDEAARAADALVAGDVLEPGRPLRFTHPVVLSAIRESIPSAERGALHRAAARALDTDVRGPEVAAGQLMACDPAGEDWAVDVLRRAAHLARVRGAPDSASAYLRRAVAEPPPEAVRADVMLELATVATVAGEPDAAELVEEARRLAPSASARMAATIVAGDHLAINGRAVEAIGVVREAMLGADISDDLRQLAAGMLTMWSLITLPAHRAAADLTPGPYALTQAMGPLAPARLLALAALELGVFAGDAETTIKTAERAYGGGRLIAENPANRPFPYMAIIGLNLAGRFEQAERWADDAAAHNMRQGSLISAFGSDFLRAWSRLERGDVEGAEADAHAALELTEHASALLVMMPLFAAVFVRVKLVTGALEEGDRLLDALPPGAVDPLATFAIPLFEARAQLRLAQDRPREALADLAVCETWEREWPAEGGGWLCWRAVAAEAHAALGDAGEARRLALEGLERARRFGAPRHIGIALRAVALTAPEAERRELLEEAVRTLDAGGLRVESAATRISLGRVLVEAGRTEQAQAVLELALAQAMECSATAAEAAAREGLVGLGARPRRRALTGRAALTHGERRVAELAAQGLANKEIAQQLFLTPKTVENHLTSAYRKLDIGSRTQLATALR